MYNFFRFPYFFFFFHYHFIIYIDVTHIAASNTATDDSQIKSYIEYLIRTYNIFVLVL